MDHYIGIDLGTTNSAICSYNGRETQIYKSPEQSDVTPSAIYVDKRGRRYYGRRAYEMASMNDRNSATLFKRYMGTAKQFTFEATGETLTPEACSAEILRLLFGYLPEEVRNDPDTAAVITVPAAFNQMKKDATLEAAKMAGIGRVALMQEPVAAVMSVMKQDDAEKIFLVYDLGGGTFDVTVAQSIAGRVNLLVQGGKEMCGGRDWDRMIYRKVVLPWLHAHFELPDDPSDPVMKKISRLSMLAIEQAKIELSACEETAVRMDEVRLGAQDLDGEEIYLDIPLSRGRMDELIADQIEDTIAVTKENLAKVGLQPADVGQIVFIGGPTCYKPLRDKVTAALGLETGVEVNPMTAVAEGAAIYAESIDWASVHHERKAGRGEKQALHGLRINYEKRVSSDKGRIALISEQEDLSVEITSLDTGWVSGVTRIGSRKIIEVPLMQRGENTFRITVFDGDGMPLSLEDDRIVISRTLATVNAIPASYPIAVKALDRIGGHAVPVYLVEENDLLPKRGSVTFRAGQSLAAGSAGALVFTLWEGAIREPIEDNRYIGAYRISGTSFECGVIPAGAEIICDYEINESGTLHLGVSIPCVGINLSGKNFYSRTEGQPDVQDAARVIAEADSILRRTQQMKMQVYDPDIDRIRRIAMDIKQRFSREIDPESIQEADNELLGCRRIMAQLRVKHRSSLRRNDLKDVVQVFEKVKADAAQADISAFYNLKEEAEYAIERDLPDFDTYLEEMRMHISRVFWSKDSYIRSRFNAAIVNPGEYMDRAAFDRLRAQGIAHLEKERYDELRAVLIELLNLRASKPHSEEHMYDDVNIVRS